MTKIIALYRHIVLLPLLASAVVSAAPDTVPANWNFKVYLDDKPIGYQHFAMETKGGERQMTVKARFDARFYGLFSYRYAHDAAERWQGNCLIGLAASTDDDGRKSVVKARHEGEALLVAGPGTEKKYPGCVMTFAYWNAEILKQSRLLNPQTGEVENVSIESLGKESIAVRGAQVNATHYRINGPKHPINLWYSDAGEWVALSSPLDGGRRLIYRLD